MSNDDRKRSWRTKTHMNKTFVCLGRQVKSESGLTRLGQYASEVDER